MVRYYLYMTIAALMWGGSFVGTKVALEDIGPLTLVFLRYVIGGVIVVLALRFIKMQKIESEDLRWLILLCIFEPGLYFLFETYGIKETDPTIASLIIALIPVFVLLIAYVLRMESITIQKVVGIVLSVLGVSIVSMFENYGNTTDNHPSTIKGIILIFLATITASSFTVLLSRLARKYNSFTLASFQVFFTIIFYLPLAIYENHPHYTFNWGIRSVWALIYLGLFPTFFAYLLYAKGLSKIESSVASLFINLIPIFTAVISALVLRTSPTIYTLIGGVLIIGGVSLVTIKREVKTEIPLTT
ncbi:MAG: DMT family transporter [Deltaproteobacteria bacterium]|nr:DMT family transporter [Deltaproteobacteria bacterium]